MFILIKHDLEQKNSKNFHPPNRGLDYPPPGVFALLQVPWEYFFGLKLKIYVKTTYFEHLLKGEEKFFIPQLFDFIW